MTLTRSAIFVIPLGYALAVQASPSVQAQQASDPRQVAPQSDPRAWVGERLEYEVRFGIFVLGRAALHVAGIDTVRGDSALHLRFRLQGGNVLYRIDNQWDSWVALEGFTSRRFIQDHNEGGRKYRHVYDILPDSGYYRQEGVDTIAPTSPLPLDDAAFFYAIRLMTLDPGRLEMNRYFKPDRNPVVLEVLRREVVDVPAGRFNCIVVRPIIKGGGIFREQAEGLMWISDSPERIVVQVRSKFVFGALTLRLTKVTIGVPEGL
jgi:hypothetical protein